MHKDVYACDGGKKSETTWMSETYVNGILCSWKKELDIYLMTWKKIHDIR